MKCKHNNLGYCLLCEADENIENATRLIKILDKTIGYILNSPVISEDFKNALRKIANKDHKDYDDKYFYGNDPIQKLQDYANGH